MRETVQTNQNLTKCTTLTIHYTTHSIESFTVGKSGYSSTFKANI